MRRIAFMLVAILCLTTLANAAIFIQQGRTYTFGGYLVIRLANYPAVPGHMAPAVMVPTVYLSAYPNGERPPVVMGRQDLRLDQGTLSENLFTLARRFGPTTRVLVQGVGNAMGGISPKIVELEHVITLPPPGMPQ